MRIDDLGRLAGDQRYSRDFTRSIRLDNFFAEQRQVDDLAESIADFVDAIAQPEQPHLLRRQVAIDAGKGEDAFSQLDPELASTGPDRGLGDFLDAVDDCQAQRTTRAI